MLSRIRAKTDPVGRRKRDPHCAGERGAFLCDLASALSKIRTKYDLPLHHKGIRRPRRSRSRKQDLAVRPVSGACKRQSGGAAAPTAPCRASSRAAAANITLLWSSRVFFRNQRRAQKSTRGISPACGRFFSCFISAWVNIFFNLTGRVCFCKFIQHCKNIIGMV